MAFIFAQQEQPSLQQSIFFDGAAFDLPWSILLWSIAVAGGADWGDAEASVAATKVETIINLA